MNSFEQDKLWLQMRGYQFTKQQSVVFSDIVTRNYSDGMDTETARKEAAMELNLS